MSVPPQAWQVPGPPPPAPVPQTNGMAVTALVFSILGFFCLWFIGPILGIALGYMARNQIRASQGQQTGEGIALAAIIVGVVDLALTVMVVVMMVMIFGFGVFAAIVSEL